MILMCPFQVRIFYDSRIPQWHVEGQDYAPNGRTRLSRVRGCFVVSIEPPALVSGLQLNGLHLDRYLALKCQKNQQLHMFSLTTFLSQGIP